MFNKMFYGSFFVFDIVILLSVIHSGGIEEYSIKISIDFEGGVWAQIPLVSTMFLVSVVSIIL